ncbi:MAG: polyprenyl synthetase family protein [Acidobacteriota bacterium]
MVAEPLTRAPSDAEAADPRPRPARPPRLRLLDEAEMADVLAGFRELLPVSGAVEPGLRAVLIDLVEHPGSLARAQIVFGLLRDCDPLLDDPDDRDARALRLAVAVESFHTASLVFDDLPAMDDARERRGRPCSHVAHGEASAMLGALALITRAYGLLWEVLAPLPAERRAAAGELVSTCLGAEGILDGQARDLRFGSVAGERRAEEVLRVARGKTVPLVRLAVVLPALVGGAGGEALGLLERLASAWGLAYQVLDDFKDVLMSREETGKSTARDGLLGRPNLPSAVGPEAAMDRLGRLLAESGGALEALAATGFPCSRLDRLQGFLAAEADRVWRRLASERPPGRAFAPASSERNERAVRA